VRYKFLEYTGDVFYEAYGASFEEALENAAAAMAAVIAEKVREEKNFEIEEHAPTLEELVVFTLSRLLSECEIREIYLARFEVAESGKRNGEFYVKGIAYGGEGKAKTIVKGVTFHEEKIEKKNGYTIRVLLDV